MSSRGTWQTTAPNSSGRCVNVAPTSRPPFEPPMMPRCAGEVTLRAMRSSAMAMKSSNAFWCFSRTAPWCHLGPNSPPPRMFAST